MLVHGRSIDNELINKEKSSCLQESLNKHQCVCLFLCRHLIVCVSKTAAAAAAVVVVLDVDVQY